MKSQNEIPVDGFMPLSEVGGFERFSKYFVHVDGTIWSTKYGDLRRLSPGKSRRQNPYLKVTLTDDEGNREQFRVHYLIASAFVEGKSEGMEINHINRNALDNRAENLEWCTREENNLHWQKENGVKLDPQVITKVKELHAELSASGQQMPSLFAFVNALLEGEVDRWRSEFGWKIKPNPREIIRI